MFVSSCLEPCSDRGLADRGEGPDLPGRKALIRIAGRSAVAVAVIVVGTVYDEVDESLAAGYRPARHSLALPSTCWITSVLASA